MGSGYSLLGEAASRQPLLSCSGELSEVAGRFMDDIDMVFAAITT